MKWTSEQQKIIDARDSNLLVSAAAGSGKTAVLVERIIQKVLDENNPIDIDKMLVVTFTKAAASQMREKIQKALINASNADKGNRHIIKQLSLINRANITTIDSFCYKVLRENFNVIGIDPNMRVCDEAEIGLIKADIMNDLLEYWYTHSNIDFEDFIDAFSGDKNDEEIGNLIDKVYSMANSSPNPSTWLDNARHALDVESEEDIDNSVWFKLLLDNIKSIVEALMDKVKENIEIAQMPSGPLFYEKAAVSDLQQLSDIANADTYNNCKLRFETKFATLASKRGKEYDEELLDRFTKNRNYYKDEIKSLNYFKRDIEEVVDELKIVNRYINIIVDLVQDYGRRLSDAKIKKNIMDFSDVEHYALNILCQGYDEDGNVIPSKVAMDLSLDIDEVMIDEYQDSNLLQDDILNCVSKIYSGKFNIFMVGDVKQSIYKFRMARPDLFLDKYNEYMETGIKQKIELKNNFRSRDVVLEPINYIFNQIMTNSIGGIEYNEDVALVPSREFIYTDDNVSTCAELILTESSIDKTKYSDTEIEVKAIAKRIKELVGLEDEEPLAVWDSGINSYRPAMYKDIVILLRSLKGTSDIFVKGLTEEGIPVHTYTNSGFFDTVEINTIISMLSIVDNVYQDIYFAAVLRSYMGGFSDEEMATIKLLQRRLRKDKSMYNAVVRYVDCGKDVNIAHKCKMVIELICKLKEDRKDMSISELIWEILNLTNYYEYIGTMKSGKQRQANVMLLLEKANAYEDISYKGLFNFLRYIDKLKKNELDFGEVNLSGDNDNVVRIISMHKSKGLEYPIVFASNLGKKINLLDTKNKVIIHSDYYIAPIYVNPGERRFSRSIQKDAIAKAIKYESISEELRILYVALTRAEEKLILTGCCDNIMDKINSYKYIANRKEDKLSYTDILDTRSYMDWIIKSLIRNEDFNDFAEKLPVVVSADGNASISALYDLPNPIERKNTKFNIRVFNEDDIEQIRIIKSIDKMNIEDKINRFYSIPIDANIKTNINKQINLEYKYKDIASKKGKVSVTELKHLSQHMDDEKEFMIDNILDEDRKELEKISYPKFIKTEDVLPTTIGTAIHKVMELIDFTQSYTEEQINEFIIELINKKLIDEDVYERISISGILNMLNSQLGQRMKKAALNGSLYREKQFVAGLPANEVYNEIKSEEMIIIQGIVDAYFIEEDHIVIVDYKSDKAKGEKGKEELIKKYRSQLDYYAKILEQLTNRKVKSKYIYSFMLDSAIELI